MLVLVSKWCCFRQTASRQTHFHFSHLCFQNVVLISIASVMDPGLAPEVSWRFCNYWRTRTHTKNRHARPSWAQDLLQRWFSNGFAINDEQDHIQKTDTHVHCGLKTCSTGELVMVLQLMTNENTYKKQHTRPSWAQDLLQKWSSNFVTINKHRAGHGPKAFHKHRQWCFCFNLPDKSPQFIIKPAINN